jgi:integrase
MATEKVGVYRKYHGPVPTDELGDPLPKDEWPRLRPFSWAVRWFGTDGKRFSRSFKSRREAELYAETKQAEVRVGKSDQPRAVTLAEFGRMYLHLRGDLAKTTKVEHQRTLQFLQEYLGRRMIVSKATPLDARRFVAWYREREYRGRTPAPATVNRVVRECKRIFREAVACSLIHEDPFHEMRQERIGGRPWHYISSTEYRRLIEASPSLRWQGRITLGYCCGLRLGEVLNLTWADVDFERSEIQIVRKNASECRVAWTPKDKDMRIVPLLNQAASILTEVQLSAADG